MKKYFILLLIVFFLPVVVNAGTIHFNNPVKTSENTYEFTVTVDNINLNYINGNISVTNGTITKITMSSSWINATGTNHNFYFYHNGKSTGTYQVATIEVTMTDNSEYSIHNLTYGLNKCTIDFYGNYFGENGTLVSKTTYDSTCSISKEASLKSLTVSSGTLSPKFDSSLELYNVTVSNSISAITFNAVPTNSKAKVISGSTCSLKVGVNLCKIVVQAEAGNTKTYTITVTRKNVFNTTLSSDASISSLEVHGGTLTKAFDPNIKEYDVQVNDNTKEMYFTFITNSDKKSHTSQSCNITKDTKTCKLTITAEDDITKNSYLFYIIHESNTEQNTESTNTSTNNSTSSANKNNTSSTNHNTPNNNTSSKNEPENNTTTNVEVDQDSSTSNENANNNQENVEISEEIQNNQESKEMIKVPLISKEVSKDIFFKTIAVLDLFLGILIGVFVTKYYKNKK